MDFYAGGSVESGFGEREEVDVGAEVDEAGGGEGGDGAVGADAAEGVGGDGVRRAVV